MTNKEIEELLSGVSTEALEAHIDIIRLQKDTSQTLKTGHKELDDNLIGGMNNKMIFIGSRPSMGKTHHCQSTIRNLLDLKVNPNPNIKLLRMNLEMPTQALLLRELKNSLGRTMTDIVSREYSEEEKEKVKKVVSDFNDKKVTNFSRAVEGESLRHLLKIFLQKVDEQDELATRLLKANGGTSTQKTKKIVLVDHLHIYSDKSTIDNVLKICNEFKMSDPNLTFIFYFQFGRTLEDLWRDTKDKKANPLNFLPNSSHIYLTDLLMQYADIVMGMVIPQVVDLEEYASINKERNLHLSEHFTEEVDQNSFARLKGRNRIYYNFIKIRMIDSFDAPRLFCGVLDPNYEKTAEKIFQQNKFSSALSLPPDLNDKVIEIQFVPPPAPLKSLSEAFDEPRLEEDDSDAPF
jgi:archaellum biogenesis ATPase FlaH